MPPYLCPGNLASSPTFDLKVGTLTPKYTSLYDACTRRLYTQSGAMDHDQRASSILPLAKPKLIMQAGLFWVRLGKVNVY